MLKLNKLLIVVRKDLKLSELERIRSDFNKIITSADTQKNIL